MSDVQIATIARRLAGALAAVAYSRSDADKKRVSEINTELCSAVREEREANDKARTE
jgi:Ni,Fe-hydrogenase III component G